MVPLLPINNDIIKLQKAYLILNKVECFHHEIDGYLPVNTNSKHGYDSTLQTIAEDESRPTSFLHVEGYGLETAHVEERFILNSCEAWVMQEATVHEVSLLEEVILISVPTYSTCTLALVKLSIVKVIGILDDLYRVIASLGIKSTLH